LDDISILKPAKKGDIDNITLKVELLSGQEATLIWLPRYDSKSKRFKDMRHKE
jgi:hypothetical protein